mgnify:CR=1 FL=1
MNSTAYRAILLSLALVFSSFAGCLSSEEKEDATVMVSTYHVGELVTAIVGDTLTVEIISPSNVPVHDYEPSAADIVRLQNSDIFFYHGLNLEPWVGPTLDALGDDAPISVMTHTMPSGEVTLDYESLLVSDLCELLNDGPFQSTTLGMMSDDHDDHDEDGHDEDGHDEDGHDEDGHDEDGHDEDGHDEDGHDEDGHDEDGHDEDEHDDHEGHAHAEAEETIQNPAGCPTDTAISIFHMEEGEYVLEFESEHDEDFNMAALKMLGGHAHHHHGHGDDHDDHSDEEDEHDDHDDHSDEEDEHDDHDDHSDEEDDHDDHEGHDDHWEPGTCHDTETHETHEEYTDEEDCEAAGHLWMDEEHHDLPEIHADYVAHTLSFPEDDHEDHDEDHSDEEDDHDDHDDHSDEEDEHDEHDDHDDHSDEEEHHEFGFVVIHIEEEGDYGFALPNDVELFVLMNDDHDHGHEDHDDHDDHSDEEDDHDDHDDHSDEEDEHDDHDDHSDEEDEHDDHSDEEIEFDPHSWLSPLAFGAQVDLVKDVLVANYPEHASTFNENAEAFKAELAKLHIKYDSIKDECEQRTVVANHNAYSYIGKTYDIRFVTVHGLDPEGEPSAADILEVVEQIEEDGLTVLFVEEYTNLNAVAGIVEETKSDTMPDGIDIQVLYTMELPPMDSEDNYLSLMEKNLNSLKAGMGC